MKQYFHTTGTTQDVTLRRVYKEKEEQKQPLGCFRSKTCSDPLFHLENGCVRFVTRDNVIAGNNVFGDDLIIISWETDVFDRSET